MMDNWRDDGRKSNLKSITGHCIRFRVKTLIFVTLKPIERDVSVWIV